MTISYQPEQEQWTALMERPKLKKKQLDQTVRAVFDDVKRNGQQALLKYASMFDNYEENNFLVSSSDMNAAADRLNSDIKSAIDRAYDNIKLFHESQMLQPKKVVVENGVTCWQEVRAIEKVGLYIPGGSAPLFSTVLMLGIPAKIAGCEEVVLCSPGPIDDSILYCAKKLGIDKVFRIGGMQAIAALTYGSSEIPKVDKVFGPGNQYVTAAKQYALLEGLAIDIPAGPSEVLVIADKYASPVFVAADLLAQAEHGPDSQVILVSTSKNLLTEVEKELERQQLDLPRAEITNKALEYARLVYFEKEEDVIRFSNIYGPEHLIINTENYMDISAKIQTAGSVFLGAYSPESAGDYASGTNHTLPTNGFAKSYSGVELRSFQKTISFQELTREGLENLGPSVEVMAKAEGLDAHARAVTYRLNANKS